MDGELAQIVALVSYGNCHLNAGQVDLSNNSTFQFVSSLMFVRHRNRWDTHGVEVAYNAQEWLAHLKSVRTTRLWNVSLERKQDDIPEHVAVAFTGGVPMAIQADLPRGFEIWYPLWSAGGQKNSSWHVEYHSRRSHRSFALPNQSMGVVKGQLRQAVFQALTFAKRPEVDASFWADWFSKSLNLLDSPSPVIPYHPDMLPDTGYNLEARQVLASGSQAFVFGGMGSWNDMGFENPKIHAEYGNVTRTLYAVVKNAIITASNAFQPEIK